MRKKRNRRMCARSEKCMKITRVRRAFVQLFKINQYVLVNNRELFDNERIVKSIYICFTFSIK